MEQPSNNNGARSPAAGMPESAGHIALDAGLDRMPASLSRVCGSITPGGEEGGKWFPHAASVSGAAPVQASGSAGPAAPCSRTDVSMMKDTTQDLAESAAVSAASAGKSAALANRHKENAALYKYQARLESETAEAFAQAAISSASQAEGHEKGAAKACDVAREWAASASDSAASAASSAAAAASSALQVARLMREALRILEDARGIAASAAVSASQPARAADSASAAPKIFPVADEDAISDGAGGDAAALSPESQNSCGFPGRVTKIATDSCNGLTDAIK